ncbi:MAG: VOC family protein [Polyangiaceae bacterium]
MTDVNQDRIIPELIVHDGIAALEFYKAAFGAEEISRVLAKSGKLAHGQLKILGHELFVCNEFPASEGGTLKSPRTLGGTGVRITLAVDDADAVVARAVAAGATVLLAVAEMYWGGRYGKLVDPFGHEWGVNQQRRALNDAETNAAAKDFFAKPDES